MNGKEGDHPITDILLYGRSAFNPEIDDLVRELDAYGYWKNEVASSHMLELHGRIKDPALYARIIGRASTELILNNLRFLLEHELERIRRESSGSHSR